MVKVWNVIVSKHIYALFICFWVSFSLFFVLDLIYFIRWTVKMYHFDYCNYFEISCRCILRPPPLLPLLFFLLYSFLSVLYSYMFLELIYLIILNFPLYPMPLKTLGRGPRICHLSASRPRLFTKHHVKNPFWFYKAKGVIFSITMGVPHVWDLLRPYHEDSRIPFRQLVSQFRFQHGRAIRVAIDAYGWLFECGLIAKDLPDGQRARNDFNWSIQGDINKATVNFMSRLKELLSLDVTFILVFDGPLKPEFKNQNKKKSMISTEEYKPVDYAEKFQKHLSSHKQYGRCTREFSPGFTMISEPIKIVTAILKAWNISYLEACAEGEAQCAWLQHHGYVDYVMSNDSDVFMFGATKVLKNYSKLWEDAPSTTRSPDKRRELKESFVTVVDMDEIGKVTGYNQWSLLLFGVLLGADYSQGIKDLGVNKASNIALLREPNFTHEFREIFHTTHKLPNERMVMYKAFQKRLFSYCQNNTVSLFGKEYRAMFRHGKFEGWPSDIVVMHYFHPFIKPDIDDTVFSCEHVNISGDLHLDGTNFRKLQAVLRQHKFARILNFEKWFHETMHQSLLLKKLLYGHEKEGVLDQKMRVTEQSSKHVCDEKFQIPLWKIRYNSFLQDVEEPSINLPSSVPSSPEAPTLRKKSRSPTRRQLDNAAYKYYMWIPSELVPESHALIGEFYERKKQELSSPLAKKRSSKQTNHGQKNNLDDFLKKFASPLEKCHVAKNAEQRTLFVNEDSDSDGNQRSDTDENNSSLMIIDKETYDQECSNHLKKRKLVLLPDTDGNSTENEDENRTPKKQRLDDIQEFQSVRRRLEFEIDLTCEEPRNAENSADAIILISDTSREIDLTVQSIEKDTVTLNDDDRSSDAANTLFT